MHRDAALLWKHQMRTFHQHCVSFIFVRLPRDPGGVRMPALRRIDAGPKLRVVETGPRGRNWTVSHQSLARSLEAVFMGFVGIIHGATSCHSPEPGWEPISRV